LSRQTKSLLLSDLLVFLRQRVLAIFFAQRSKNIGNSRAFPLLVIGLLTNVVFNDIVFWPLLVCSYKLRLDVGHVVVN